MEFDFHAYGQQALELLVHFLPSLLGAVIALFIGFWIANRADDVLERALERSSLGPEVSSFLGSMLTIVIKVFVVLTAAGMLGFETSSLVAVLAAAGFAVGFALQGSLSNFAAGILILVFRPFRVGDWISAADVFGRVEKIQILNTIIVSPGLKTLIIPNAEIIGSVVSNFSAKGVVRLELEVPMAYESSFPQVKAIFEEVLRKADHVLEKPAPEVGIVSYDSHNVVVAVRPYVHPDAYWEATFEVNRLIKEALHINGIPMAYSEGVELGSIGA